MNPRAGPWAALLAAISLLRAAPAHATVPMDPQYLPDAGLVLAGVFTGAIALYRLFRRQLGAAGRAGAISLVCFALAFVLVANCHKPAQSPPIVPGADNSVSLVLGDAVLLVAPSDRYVLSVNGRQFLDLDLRQSGLEVSCVVGAGVTATTGVDRNRISFSRSGIRPSKPDSHTFLVQGEGEDLLRVHFAGPRRIEIGGQFFEGRSAEPALISFRNGISWSDGNVPPRTVIDLRSQGAGRIDFGRSGLVHVLPPGD